MGKIKKAGKGNNTYSIKILAADQSLQKMGEIMSRLDLGINTVVKWLPEITFSTSTKWDKLKAAKFVELLAKDLNLKVYKYEFVEIKHLN